MSLTLEQRESAGLAWLNWSLENSGHTSLCAWQAGAESKQAEIDAVRLANIDANLWIGSAKLEIDALKAEVTRYEAMFMQSNLAAKSDAYDESADLLEQALGPENKSVQGGIQRLINDRQASEARIADLEKENFALAAGLCVYPNGVQGDDYGNAVCPLTARIRELEKDAAIMASCINEFQQKVLRSDAACVHCYPNGKYIADGYKCPIAVSEEYLVMEKP